MAAVRIPAFLAALLALECAAAPVPATLGGERLVLDAPAGYSDSLQLSSPRLQELAETLAGPSSRVLLFALTDGDLRAFMQGDAPAFRRYMVIATPTRLEYQRLDTALFADLAAEGRRDMGAPVPPDDYIKHLDARPDGRPNLLAELRREPEVVSVLQGAKTIVRPATLFKDEESRYLISTQTLLLLRGKMLQLVVYSHWEGRPDYDWILETTERWVEELRRLNRR
jgi:hypothetical protein